MALESASKLAPFLRTSSASLRSSASASTRAENSLQTLQGTVKCSDGLQSVGRQQLKLGEQAIKAVKERKTPSPPPVSENSLTAAPPQ